MSEFAVNFSVSPWLLLLLIPALAVPFILHFKHKKEVRRTRNRIAALVLHCTAIICAILALSGIYFTYELPDERNELVILVDASFSTGTSRDRADKFVYDVLSANDGRCKTAIVTFGFDQSVALEPGVYGADEAFEIYKNAEPPKDITATDICAALEFCWNPVSDTSGEGVAVISHPESARIVIVGDGIETDQKAQTVARRIMMDGVKIDTTFFGSDKVSDMWISNVEYPDESVEVGDTVNFDVEIKSTFEGQAKIYLQDVKNGSVIASPDPLQEGVPIGNTNVTFPYKFTSAGHHEVKITLECEDDFLTENNVYYTFFDIDEDCKILILEKYKGDSETIKNNFKEKIDAGEMGVDVMTVGDEGIPQTSAEMQEYDEIILNNIAYRDFEEDFWKNLQLYVWTYGGGVFTVGGLEKNDSGTYDEPYFADGYMHGKPHAYDEADMGGTIYEEMLPVDITEFVPPVGLAIVVDCSGSMLDHSTLHGTLVDTAIEGALGCVAKLSSRDYVCVIILADTYEVQLEMTPLSKRGVVKNAIRDIADFPGGSTNYSISLEAACRQLSGLPSDVRRKHILLLSDGAPGEGGDYDFYERIMKKYEKEEITMTITDLNGGGASGSVMNLAEKMNTEVHGITPDRIGELPDIFLQDLDFDDKIYGAIKESYNIKIASQTKTLSGIDEKGLQAITLDGFYTSVLKGYNGVENPLLAQYVPLYAQWKYGAGRVGSYMCDIGGLWGNALTQSEEGKKLLDNIVTGLLPTVDIRLNTITAKFIEDNYRTQVSVFNFDNEEERGKKLVAYVECPNGDGKTFMQFDLSELSPGGNRFTFENKAAGVYTVTIVKVSKSFNPFVNDVSAAQGAGGAVLRTYRVFSYSKEYLTESDTYTNGKNLMIDLSSRDDAEGEEKFVYDPQIILDNFHFLVKNIDPRVYLLISAIVLLLTGVIARKFKFKWLHELFGARRKDEADGAEA